MTDGLENGQRVATTGAFELAKLDPDVLAKTNVQIQPPKEEEEDENAVARPVAMPPLAERPGTLLVRAALEVDHLPDLPADRSSASTRR